MNKILFIDDEEIVARQASRMLRLKGYDVVVVNDSEAAVSKVEEHQPDLILMDLEFEGSISGLEATRRIRTNAATQDVPVIVVSGSYLATFQAEAYNAGANDVDEKPFDFGRLCSKIEAALSRTRKVAP